MVVCTCNTNLPLSSIYIDICAFLITAVGIPYLFMDTSKIIVGILTSGVTIEMGWLKEIVKPPFPYHKK